MACAPEPGADDRDAAGPGSVAVPMARSRFVDITETAGIDFAHANDASEDRLLPETMGAGAAFLDYDDDGLPDLFLVNGGRLPHRAGTGSERTTAGATSAAGDAPAAATGRLYRNLGQGRFADVTVGSGLDVPLYGMGAAVGDVDDDGHVDLVVTGLGRSLLFRNQGDGTFAEVGAAFGFAPRGFATSAAFLDYDRDGFLDLFVCRYVAWSPETDLVCRPDGVHRIYCTPESYPAVTNLLFRNEGGRRFVDVSAAAGISAHPGKALGVVPLDGDGDGWPDLVVANDTERNVYFRNRGDGTFEEIGVPLGVAYSESGAPRGGMGIDAGDLDADGRSDIVITNFSHEMVALFRATETGRYLDDAAHLGLGFPTLLTLGFGVLVEDFDLDGHLDVLVANGHIEPRIAEIQRGQSYAQVPQLFYGAGGGRLVPAEGEAAFTQALVARGLAGADIDGDGDTDLLVTQNGGTARLYRNDAPPHAWVRVVLEDGGSGVRFHTSLSAYGAVVTLHGTTLREGRAEPFQLRKELVSGRSYLSASETVLGFGLGMEGRADSLVVDWPSGSRSMLASPPLRQRLVLREGGRIVKENNPVWRGATQPGEE